MKTIPTWNKIQRGNDELSFQHEIVLRLTFAIIWKNSQNTDWGDNHQKENPHFQWTVKTILSVKESSFSIIALYLNLLVKRLSVWWWTITDDVTGGPSFLSHIKGRKGLWHIKRSFSCIASVKRLFMELVYTACVSESFFIEYRKIGAPKKWTILVRRPWSTISLWQFSNDYRRLLRDCDCYA